jgi:hypothetical protein
MFKIIVSLFLLCLVKLSYEAFPGCKFKFGMGYRSSVSNYAHVDYISIWVGDGDSFTRGSNLTERSTNFNIWWHGAMLNAAVKYSKLPVFYGYVIPFMAKDLQQLLDCDISNGKPDLCKKGAEFIRTNRAGILSKYKHYATEAAKIIGSTGQIIWLIEPDFWQYSSYSGNPQLNGGLSGTYMRTLFDDIATNIKSALPNAKISWDISPWLTETEMTKWWGFFSTSSHISYIHTSGARTKANSAFIRTNELKWSFMSTLTKKQIIADTGYGPDGVSMGHTPAWDDATNLKSRITNGVVAITQSNAYSASSWSSILSTVRPQLPALC